MELFDQLVDEAGQGQPTAMPVPGGTCMAGESWIAVFEHVVSTSNGKVLSRACVLTILLYPYNTPVSLH